MVEQNGPAPLVEVEGMVKSFGENAVLRDVSLALRRSDVMAVVGGNGAGKSTLMKILAGIYTPDKGSIRIEGSDVSLHTPSAAHAMGVYLVPQEPLLFPNMTVEENLSLGLDEPRTDVRKRAVALIKRLNWPLSMSRQANSLSIAEQQLVEILRGLLRSAKVLILDEPTSSLTFAEIQSLFKLIKELRAEGVGIFYITHRLDEVFEIATHVAILRDGRVTLEGPVGGFTRELLLQGLLPSESRKGSAAARTKTLHRNAPDAKPALVLDRVSGYGFRDVSLSVYPGEVLGIAGVVGAGRTELAEAVFGIGKLVGGRVLLEGADITGCGVRDAIRKGLNYIPEDRRRNGLFGAASVRANVTSAVLDTLGRVFLPVFRERKLTSKYIEEFSISTTGQEQSLGALSGGNQQKVIISRILATNPKVLILDEPTRGIDAGARGDVYRIIDALKAEGLAVLLISSDMEEILALSDRVVTMYNGAINREFGPGEIALDGLMAASFGVC